MGAIIEIFIVCDTCGENHGTDCRNNTSVSKQRKSAKLNGWRFYKGKDYCPSCTAVTVDFWKELKIKR